MKRVPLAAGLLGLALAGAPAAFAQTARGPLPAPAPAPSAAAAPAGEEANTQVTRVIYGDVKRLNLTPEQRSWIQSPGAAPVAEPKTLVQVLDKFPHITAEDWRSLGKEMEKNGGRIVILRF